MNKQIFITIGLVLFTVVILAASLRGLPGSPTSIDLNDARWKEDGPLELSPDRGRFALTYSLVEDGSFIFSLPVARLVTPDLAINNGNYVSLFAPGVSFLIIPGYLLGKAFGAAQVGAFAVVALFAVLNVLLVREIAVRSGAHPLAAAAGALAFIFASPAFTYAVTLYQHHISLFLILLGVYALLRWNSLWSVALIWFLWATAVVVDNPNLFLMLPVGVGALGQLIAVQRSRRGLHVTVRAFGIVTLLGAVLPIAFFLWFNYYSNSNPLQLSGTLTRVLAIDADGSPAAPEILTATSAARVSDSKREKTAVGFFATRNMLEGFYIHMLSPDRGVVRFAPVLLLGIFGLVLINRKADGISALLVSIIGINVVLYSMWADPWGGWAFGSRYLIPAYAVLAIGLAAAISHWRAKPALLFIFLALFGYSVWVNALGAITSSANPPQVEVLALEELSGREQKYTYARNWDFLASNKSKSFVWQTIGRDYVSAPAYHQLLTTVVIAAAAALTVGLALAGFRLQDKVL